MKMVGDVSSLTKQQTVPNLGNNIVHKLNWIISFLKNDNEECDNLDVNVVSSGLEEGKTIKEWKLRLPKD